jgi:hypothetical protein
MKYFTFYRENNNFKEMLTDPALKKIIRTQIQWSQHLMIGLDELNDKTAHTISYLVIKYGDDLTNNLAKDFTPVSGVDYAPDDSKNKYTKVII